MPPAQAGPQDTQKYKMLLQQAIQEKRLQNFFPPNSPTLDRIAQRAPQQINDICARWKLPTEVGNDIVKLGLYDVIIFIGMQVVRIF